MLLDHLEDLQKTIDYIYNNPKNVEEDVLNDNENNSNVLNKSNSKTNKSENSPITKKEAIDYLLANVFTSKDKLKIKFINLKSNCKVLATIYCKYFAMVLPSKL